MSVWNVNEARKFYEGNRLSSTEMQILDAKNRVFAIGQREGNAVKVAFGEVELLGSVETLSGVVYLKRVA